MVKRVHVSAVVGLSGLLLGSMAHGQTTPRRPTPREAIEQSLGPVRDSLTALSVTEDERQAVEDLVARAETAAAERVEAEHRRDLTAVEARTARITLVVEAIRHRVAALRAEARANQTEQAVLAAEARRTQSRGALERLSEARILAERTDAVSGRAVPPPETTAAPANVAPQQTAMPPRPAAAPAGGAR